VPRLKLPKPTADVILEAAERLFAERGYAGVSLRQIIAAAGVSTTAFYARFESKAAVLDALGARFFADLQAEAARVLGASKSLADGIERGVDLVCDKFEPKKALVRLIIAESGSLAPTSQSRQKAYAMLAAFLAHRFTSLVERGRIRVHDPNALAWALVGALEIQIVRWAVWNEFDLARLRDALIATAYAVIPEESPEEIR
jgi:AcrR family transcriptional regulator